MEIKGDFLGFEFAGKRSETLGIIRVSDSDRYKDTLQPEIKNITAEVPGMDGEYYFGSNFGVKNFSISFAFDSLTEQQLRKLRQVFGTKEIKPLIFDECPYKKYLVKIENPVELNYICFEEDEVVIGEARDGVRRDSNSLTGWEQVTPYVKTGNKRRVYKGEGTVEFISYFPFAKSAYKTLPIDIDTSDWAAASGLLDAEHYDGIFDTYSNGEIKLYNPGDIETGFRLYIPFTIEGNTATLNSTTLTYMVNDENKAGLVIDGFEINIQENSDKGILIDTNTGLITGVLVPPESNNADVSYITSGNLYNQYVSLGNFFKIQPDVSGNSTIEITGGINGIQIFYDYLYF